jgi:hypothetical protein
MLKTDQSKSDRRTDLRGPEGCFTDYSKVEKLRAWYKSVNSGEKARESSLLTTHWSESTESLR